MSLLSFGEGKAVFSPLGAVVGGEDDGWGRVDADAARSAKKIHGV